MSLKVVHKKDPNKKYTCTVCSLQFKWDKNSSWFGDYKSPPKAIFCSSECESNFQKKLNV